MTLQASALPAPVAPPRRPTSERPSSVHPAPPLVALRLDLVHTFVVVAEERGAARSAEQLFLSPSGLTRRLALLERQLGRQLVSRAGGAFALTQAGVAFLPHARALLVASHRAWEALGPGRAGEQDPAAR